MKIRCLVVDDEPLGRERIVSLLAKIPDAEVMGECETGTQAIQAIAEHSPDLVFLDVQMPESDGFDVIDAIGPEVMPATIFVTAYDQYALKAFEVHACDYLLKPFDTARFTAAFRHVAERIRNERANHAGERLAGLVERLERDRPQHRQLPVRANGRVYFLDIDEIDWLEAADNYVKVHANGETHLVRQTLQRFEESLSPQGFVRVHRSAIVNVARIREVQPWFGGEYVVLLRNGTKVATSRTYRPNLQARMDWLTE